MVAGAVIAVVGVSGGLGTPIAHSLAERGAHLLLAGPHLDRLAARAIPGAAVVLVDLRDASTGDRVAAVALGRPGLHPGLVGARIVTASEQGDSKIDSEQFTANP